ncbi:hypothetical protein EYF80_025371 [Liparis tanakae]|uniref:Uncharacterized protein n=1 Tax=Liparis tanakae TaxID=230148 RepID=A0A4Z2HFP9_9TELE|nr:hypothetical protein EYF80_025371 [Liparis tanakae]
MDGFSDDRLSVPLIRETPRRGDLFLLEHLVVLEGPANKARVLKAGFTHSVGTGRTCPALEPRVTLQINSRENVRVPRVGNTICEQQGYFDAAGAGFLQVGYKNKMDSDSPFYWAVQDLTAVRVYSPSAILTVISAVGQRCSEALQFFLAVCRSAFLVDIEHL